MLPWIKAVEFARDLVEHVFLLNLIVWESAVFAGYKTEEPAYTEHRKKTVSSLCWTHHHNFANKLVAKEGQWCTYDYAEFTSRLYLLELFKNDQNSQELQFLTDCTVIAYLGMEYFHNEISRGPYFATLAIVEYYLKMFESGEVSCR